MKKILTILIAGTLFAQSANIIVITPQETKERIALQKNLEAAQTILDRSQKDIEDYDNKLIVKYNLSGKPYSVNIKYNKDFTAFQWDNSITLNNSSISGSLQWRPGINGGYLSNNCPTVHATPIPDFVAQ